HWLSLNYALDLLVLIAEKAPEKYPRASARWLERLLGERELESRRDPACGWGARRVARTVGRSSDDGAARVGEPAARLGGRRTNEDIARGRPYDLAPWLSPACPSWPSHSSCSPGAARARRS